MASKRGNPVEHRGTSKALSQSVVNPVASGTNTDKGNEKMRVPASKGKALNQKIVNPVAMRSLNKTGAKGAC